MDIDDQGRVTSVTDPLGHTTTWEYDARHLVTARTDARGNKTRYTWTDREERIEVILPDGATTKTEYDDRGRSTATVDPMGHRTSLVFDDVDRPTGVTNPLSATTRYAWDVQGNLLSITDPNGNVTRHEYDSLNRRIKTTDPLGHLTQRAFDPEGNLLTVTNPMGFVTRYSFDALDRLVTITDARNAKTQVGYDAVGNRASETDANGHTTTLGYDSLNRRVEVRDPLHRATTFSYNADGTLASMTDARNLATSYEYDLAGRRVRRFNSDTDDRYEFDEVGNLTRASNANSILEYRYNERNLLVESRYPDVSMRVGYTYDPVGRMASMTYPGGEVTSYERDAAGQVTGVVDSQAGRMTMAFDPAGRMTRESWPNGLAVKHNYDTADHLLGIEPENPDPKGIPAIHYSYDPRGNRLTMDRSDLGLSAYTYDEISQLLTAKLPDGDLQAYTFDPVGNRLSLQDHRGTQRYRYDSADQLLDVGSDFNPEGQENASPLFAGPGAPDPAGKVFKTVYGFDSAGNEVSKVGPGKKTTSYTFNALERLVGVDSPGSVPERYAYDPEGRRCAILQGQKAVKTRFLREGRDRPVLVELDGSGKPKIRYIILPGGQLLARVGPVDSKPVFYHFDALGSTVALTDSSARVITRFSYDPYGAGRSLPVSDECFGFVGREGVSAETCGLSEMGVRFYGADVGRFTSVDPLIASGGGLFQRFARYSYCRGAPTNRIDPTGMIDKCVGVYFDCLNECANPMSPGPSPTQTASLAGGTVAAAICPSLPAVGFVVHLALCELHCLNAERKCLGL